MAKLIHPDWPHPFASLDASVHTPSLNRQREGLTPAGNLLLQVVDLLNLATGDLGLEVLELVGLLGQRTLDLLANLDGLINVGSHTLKVSNTEATGSHGRGADTDSARGQGRLVAGDRVLVASNVDLLQDSLDTSTVKADRPQVDEDHVRVSSIRDKLVAQGLELILQGLGVVDDLLLVGLEVGGVGLLQGDGQSGDSVVVGTTLVAREHREVNGVLKVVQLLLAGLGVD